MLNIMDLTTQDSPLEVFQAWYEEAKSSEQLPDGFSLATADAAGRVSSRYLNYKGIEENNIIFVGHFDSQKSKQIEQNQCVALNFFWATLGKQIRIEGIAKKMSDDISDKHFYSREELSRLASILSNQSKELKDYSELKQKFVRAKEAVENKDQESPDYINVEKRPNNWGAFGVTPTLFEFFVYGEHRLNKRYEYKLNQGEWQGRWLFP